MEYKYEILRQLDIVELFKPLLKSGEFFIRPKDGKITIHPKTKFETEWIHTIRCPIRQCALWHHIMFAYGRFVPKFCMNCWKVVVRPRTLSELFKLMEIQEKIGKPCKCGIEKRATVGSLYGGYFYTNSKDVGRERYRTVRKAVDEGISPDVPVILKRYCTEFEHALGASDKQEYTEDMMVAEKIINENFDIPDNHYPQPGIVKLHTIRMWIEWAFKNGDQTYKEFTDGKPLVPGYVTYHNDIEKKMREKNG